MSNPNPGGLCQFNITWRGLGMEHPFVLEIERHDESTVADLKLKLAEMIDCPPKTQQLWNDRDMVELQDDFPLDPEYVGGNIWLETYIDMTSIKVQTAFFEPPMVYSVYNVDTMSVLKNSVCKTMVWWDAALESKEIDVDLVLYANYSKSTRRKYRDDLKIDNLPSIGEYFPQTIDGVFTFKVKAPGDIGAVKVFKLSVLDFLEIYIEAVDSNSVYDLKCGMEKVFNMTGLLGLEMTLVQDGKELPDDLMLEMLQTNTWIYAKW